MPWKALAVGAAAGYILATSSVPRDLIAVLIQPPAASSRTAIAIVAFGIVAAFLLLILAPLYACAQRERASYSEIDPSQCTSFTAQLKRRGSLGHLEFLQPTLQPTLRVLMSRSAGAGSSAPARSDVSSGAGTSAVEPPEERLEAERERRPRRSRGSGLGI